MHQRVSADDMFYLLFKDNRDEFVKNVALKGVQYNLIYKIRDVSAKLKFGWLYLLSMVHSYTTLRGVHT